MISVLYVDDELPLLDIGKQFLEGTGNFTVDTAGSARVALRKLGEHHYDAVISDYEMPGMDGIELLKIIRKDYPGLPFIIFTGKGRAEVAIEAFENGADSYLQKGGAPKPQYAELIHTIEKVVAARRSESDLKISETRYRRLFETAQDGILILDEKTGNIIDANPFILTLLGYSSEDILGKKLWEIGFIQDKTRARSAFNALQKDGYIRYEELPLKAKSGRILNVEFISNVYPVNGSKIIQCNIRDISDRVRAEAGLRASEKIYRAIIEQMPDLFYRADLAGNLTMITPKGAQMAGYNSPDEMIGLNIGRDLYAAQKERERFLAALAEKGEVSDYPLTLKVRDGTCRHVTVSSHFYYDDQGTVLGVEGIVHDITDRIQAEDALREREEKYRDFFRTSRDGVFITTVDGRLEDVNDALVELLGYADKEELLKVRVVDLYADPDSRKEHIRAIQAQGSIKDYPVGLRKNDGTVIQTLITTVVRKDGAGNTIGFQGTIRDVTELMRAENALRESEEKFRNIFDQITDAVHIHEIGENGQPGRFVEVNEVACRMLGYSREELLCQSPLDSVTGYHSRRVEDIAQELSTNGSAIFETEHRRKDGVIVPVEINARKVRLLGRDLILAIVRDITERKRAEEALRESEKRYRNVVEGQTEFICRFTPDGTHIFLNEAYCRYFGKKREEMIGHRFIPSIPPGDQQPVRDHFASLTRENPVATVEHRIIMPDGTIRWQHWTDRAIFDKQGNIREFQSVGSDITDRKEAELALEIAHAKLNMLNSITRHDIQNKLLVVRGYMSLIREAVQDPAIHPYLKNMENAARAIAEQLEFARDYHDLGAKVPVWLTLGDVLKQVGFQMPPGPPDLKTDIEDLQVYADPLYFKVWYNLWENTLRHAGQATTITVTAKETPEGLVIIYADDGQGIPLSEKENIFERGHGKNTGLGLFFVREILAITKMTIRETGEPGKGARFEITVPKGAYRFTGRSEHA